MLNGIATLCLYREANFRKPRTKYNDKSADTIGLELFSLLCLITVNYLLCLTSLLMRL